MEAVRGHYLHDTASRLQADREIMGGRRRIVILVGAVCFGGLNFLTGLGDGWRQALPGAVIASLVFLTSLVLVVMLLRKSQVGRLPRHWRAVQIDDIGLRITETSSEYALGEVGEGPADATATIDQWWSWGAIAVTRRTARGWALRSTLRHWVFLPFTAFGPHDVARLDELISQHTRQTAGTG
jgi:hypothetical protein